MAYTTFPNEKVLVQSNGCTLVECDAQHRPGRQYVAVTRDGFRTDYPHWDGVDHVVWDNPEWFPVTFREKAGRVIFNARKEYKAFNDAAWEAKHGAGSVSPEAQVENATNPPAAPAPVVASLITAQAEPEVKAKKAYSNDMEYVYNADVYCEDCATEIQDELNAKGVQDDGDSNTYPQGPYSVSEADAPQHCGNCHTFLHNPLTQEGYDYVREKAVGDPNSPVVQEWIDYYGDDRDLNGVPMTASAKTADEQHTVQTSHGEMSTGTLMSSTPTTISPTATTIRITSAHG